MRLWVALLSSLLVAWLLPVTAVRVTPSHNLQLWLKYSVGKTLAANQEHLLNQQASFVRAIQGFGFNPEGFLDDYWGMAKLKVFDDDEGRLVSPNKAMLPDGWPEDSPAGLGELYSSPLDFITAVLDRLLEVIDPQLVEVAKNCVPAITTGLAFFSSKFMWLLGNQVMDPNVCMPFNLIKVKAAKYMACRKPQGYLAVTLGDGSSPKCPCCEYAHRLLCFFFNGPPLLGKECVSHRCHNKGCLNPSHLVWASAWDNYHQVKREHTHDP